ncbi:MAG: hypothetical protein JSW50_16710 [Candidatus Latescibacterota bacterium]|nr:MAG: hypothetical protein JSW50_16710 [Candidatus Latescibacterota bacterium]
MVVFNYAGSEINAKIVYYGPALGGKTTNLESIYERMPSDAKGKMVSMKTRTDRTLFFDFLPIELGAISGFKTRMLLYTVPGQVYYNATRKLVLKGADAVVFVADSDPSKLKENIESLRNLEENLNEHDLTLDTIPWLIQYNKRDLADALPVSTLEAELNLLNVPSFEAVATQGIGVYETFQAMAGMLYTRLAERLEHSADVPHTGPQTDPVDQVAPGDAATPATDNVRQTSDAPTPVPIQSAQAPPVDSKQPAATGQTRAAAPARPAVSGDDPAVTVVVEAALREVDDSATTATAAPPATPATATGQDPNKRQETAAGQAGSPAPLAAQHKTAEPRTDGKRHGKAAPSDGQQPVPHTPSSAQRQAEPGPPGDHLEMIQAPGDGGEDDTFRFESLEETHMDQQIGRVIDLDDKPADRTEMPVDPGASGDFITDPCTTADQSEITKEQDPSDVIAKDKDVMLSQRPDVPMRSTEDECVITVPVLLTRSQIRKTIPIKLTLEIQIVDDDL